MLLLLAILCFILGLLFFKLSKKLKSTARALEASQRSEEEYRQDLLGAVESIRDAVSPPEDQTDKIEALLRANGELKRSQAVRREVSTLCDSIENGEV